jgi:hypothetical protein
MEIKRIFIKTKGLTKAPKYCHYKTHQAHAGAINKTYQEHAGAIIKTSYQNNKVNTNTS